MRDLSETFKVRRSCMENRQENAKCKVPQVGMPAPEGWSLHEVSEMSGHRGLWGGVEFFILFQRIKGSKGFKGGEIAETGLA